MPTIGVDVTSHQLDAFYESKVDNEIWVHFWNIAYPEVRGKHLAAFLKDANGVIVVFDSTDLKSIQAVDEWRLTIEQHLPTASEGRRPARFANKGLRPVPMILLANKSDIGKPVMKPADLDLVILLFSFHFVAELSVDFVCLFACFIPYRFTLVYQKVWLSELGADLGT